MVFLLIFFLFIAPSEAPDPVAATNVSSTSLVLEWSHLPEEHFQGKPIGYIITYHTINSDCDKNVVWENVTRNATTLTNLTVYTVYVINVSAVSSGGIGPTNTVRTRTDAEGNLVSRQKNLHCTLLSNKNKHFQVDRGNCGHS